MSEQSQAARDERIDLRRTALKSPRAAAIAGILFAVLFAACIILIRLSIPEDVSDPATADWLEGDTSFVVLGFTLFPFAGIAFLWFIGVVRDRLGNLEDQLFSTVFFGSGLLFLAMMFAAAAVAGGLVNMHAASGVLERKDISIFGGSMVYTIMRVYAIRMAGVFMISLGTIAVRTHIMPRWLAFLTYGLALVLLLTVSGTPLLILIFPAWVFVVSVFILVANMRGETTIAEEVVGASQT